VRSECLDNTRIEPGVSRHSAEPRPDTLAIDPPPGGRVDEDEVPVAAGGVQKRSHLEPSRECLAYDAGNGASLWLVPLLHDPGAELAVCCGQAGASNSRGLRDAQRQALHEAEDGDVEDVRPRAADVSLSDLLLDVLENPVDVMKLDEARRLANEPGQLDRLERIPANQSLLPRPRVEAV
jgi:hypothetical protein